MNFRWAKSRSQYPRLLAALFLYGFNFICVARISSADDGYGPLPLQQAHAHNDYEHARPLLDALDHGFCSVEADVWLVDGNLLVAHNLRDVKPDRTLESHYLDPLRARIGENKGVIYKSESGEPAPEFTLLIDIKSAAEPTYEKLVTVLENYRHMLTEFGASSSERHAVTVVISGNRAPELMLAQERRITGMDGRIPDLQSDMPASLMPLVSDNWPKFFKWKGDGKFPDAERQRLKEYVDTAHAQGRRIRFWGSPDRPEVWRELRAAGVDMINTDDLAGLQNFLKAASKKAD